MGRGVLRADVCGRPLFLGGGFLLFGLGAAVAVRAGAPFDLGRHLRGAAGGDRFPADDPLRERLLRLRGRPREHHAHALVGRQPRAAGRRDSPGAALVGALALAAVGWRTAYLATRSGAGPCWSPSLVAMFVLAWEYSAPPLRLCAAAARRAGHGPGGDGAGPARGVSSAGAVAARAAHAAAGDRCRSVRCSSRCCWPSSSPIAPATPPWQAHAGGAAGGAGGGARCTPRHRRWPSRRCRCWRGGLARRGGGGRGAACAVAWWRIRRTLHGDWRAAPLGDADLLGGGLAGADHVAELAGIVFLVRNQGVTRFSRFHRHASGDSNEACGSGVLLLLPRS